MLTMTKTNGTVKVGGFGGKMKYPKYGYEFPIDNFTKELLEWADEVAKRSRKWY